jgi:hypothetical protein
VKSVTQQALSGLERATRSDREWFKRNSSRNYRARRFIGGELLKLAEVTIPCPADVDVGSTSTTEWLTRKFRISDQKGTAAPRGMSFWAIIARMDERSRCRVSLPIPDGLEHFHNLRNRQDSR